MQENKMDFEERIVKFDTPMDLNSRSETLFKRTDSSTNRSIRSKADVEVYEKKNVVAVKSRPSQEQETGDREEKKNNVIVYSIRKDSNNDDSAPRRVRSSRKTKVIPSERHDSARSYNFDNRMRYPDLTPLVYPIIHGLQHAAYQPPAYLPPAVPSQIHIQPREVPALPPPSAEAPCQNYCCKATTQGTSCQRTEPPYQSYCCKTTTHGTYQRAEPPPPSQCPYSQHNQEQLPAISSTVNHQQPQASYDYVKKNPLPYYFDSATNRKLPLTNRKQPKETLEKIPSYLCMSIITCLLCPVCGIIALFFSNESRNHYKVREYNTAYTSGLRAKSFAYCGIFTNLVLIVLSAIIAGITVGVLKSLNKI